MGSRVKPTRIMCVNCNICVNKMRRYPALTLDSRVTALICSWVYPQIILEDDCVCEACRDLATAAVNNTMQREVSGNEEVRPSMKGHTNVCLLCGCSTHNNIRQSDIILKKNPTEMQQSIMNIIESKVAPREISSSDRVCHACWLRTKREVLRNNCQDSIDNLQPHENLIQQPSTQPGPTQAVELANYKQAANSIHSYIFPNSSSTKFHKISDNPHTTQDHHQLHNLSTAEDRLKTCLRGSGPLSEINWPQPDGRVPSKKVLFQRYAVHRV